ncbi:hypothetical protein NVP1285O_05 [Vibrio phage 1.285.O._10N.286.55.C12]|nr:hypothetical protein NVP1285O_05 [Vibrio phage 1.285.O._10N.286.55.C12]
MVAGHRNMAFMSARSIVDNATSGATHYFSGRYYQVFGRNVYHYCDDWHGWVSSNADDIDKMVKLSDLKESL